MASNRSAYLGAMDFIERYVTVGLGGLSIIKRYLGVRISLIAMRPVGLG